MTIEWNEDLELGVEVIDRQHRAFFEQRDKFFTASSKLLIEEGDTEKVRDEIDELFYFLTDYFQTHFADEEELLKENNFPHYERHKKEHQNFIEEVRELKYKFLQNEEIDIELLQDLNDKITDWFVNHISKKDKNIAEHLN
ncbi:MAG: hemerythrin family protein [Halanaerobacter sp.]